MKYKAIISDVDDTFMHAGDMNTPTPVVMSAIRRAVAKGVAFVLATARPMAKVEHLLDIFPTEGLIILDNGASIYRIKNKELLWESLIDYPVTEKIFAIALKHKQVGSIGLGTREGRMLQVEEISKDWHIRRINIKGLNIRQAQKVKKELESLEEDISITIIQGSSLDPNLFDVFITNANASKQHAIIKIADMMGITMQEMIGIGDHNNDFPLLMACGLKVAMGNAVPELKAIADYIAPTVDEDGVADVIEKFILSD